MSWEKVLWGLNKSDYYPGPDGRKLYTRWKSEDSKFLLDVCENPEEEAYNHVLGFTLWKSNVTAHAISRDRSAEVFKNAVNSAELKKRDMTEKEIRQFYQRFSLVLEDFPQDKKDGVIADLKEYCNCSNKR